MKKVAIVAAFVLVASLSAMQVNAQTKIGYVNMQEIIMDMPETAQADSSLQDFRNDLIEQARGMRSEFQTNAQAFIKDSLSMSDAIKEVKREELQGQQQRIAKFQQTIQQKLSQQQQKLYQPIITKAQNAVNTVAEAKGYTWVFNDTGNGSILLVKPEGENLTDAVKANLGIE